MAFAIRRLPGKEVREHFCDSAKAPCLFVSLNSVSRPEKDLSLQ